jgi:hypothetical protein
MVTLVGWGKVLSNKKQQRLTVMLNACGRADNAQAQNV